MADKNTGSRAARHTKFQLRASAWAAAALLAPCSLPAAAQFYAVSGAVSSSPINLFPIDVNTALLDLAGNTLNVGNGAVGSFSALSGATLDAASLQIATNGNGTGTVNASGPATTVTLGGTGGARLGVGVWGNGSMTVSGGALVDGTSNTAGCTGNISICGSFVGQAAGANATLTISGAGSEVRTIRFFSVAQTSVFTQAIDGFNFGTPGGTTTAAVNVLAGGTLRSQQTSLGQAPPTGNPSSLGTEKAFANALIDGTGSRWIVSNSTIDNAAAGITAGNGLGGHATMTVSNGGSLIVGSTSGAGPNDFINLGVNGGSASLTVTGAGSSVVLQGIDAVLQAGRSGAGGSGSFSVLAGATATSLFSNIGRDGATGTMLIDGAGSVFTQSGVAIGNAGNTAGQPAFATIGRDGGSGSVTVSNGGHWLINDGGGDTRPVGSPGVALGRGVGSHGSLTIDGVGSVVQIVSTSLGVPPGTADNFNPFFAVGYDNPATTSGTLLVSNGGQLLMTGNAVSNATFGHTTQLAIGGRSVSGNLTPGVGGATVTGAGSQIVLSGYDAFVSVGRGAGGSGTLSVLDQGRLASTSLLAAEATSGTILVDNARIELSGYRTDSSNTGAGSTIGRGVGGNGVLTMNNGALFTIDNNVLAGGMSIGGDQFVAGGTGTVTLSGGSSILMTGSVVGGAITVGRSGSGSLSLSGASFIDAGNTRTVYVGREAGGVGNLSIAGGSQVLGGIITVGGADDTNPGGNATAIVTGAGSLLGASGASGFIAVGRLATGALTVSNQGTVAGIVLNVGRGVGSAGTMTVDNGIIQMSGQQTSGNLSGAALSIGNRGGTGSVSLTNGSQVTMTNFGSSGASLNLGGTPPNPLGTGTLTVDGGSQIQIVAAPGLATARIGHDGSGTASFAGGSRLDVGDGQVLIAGQTGSSGTLSLLTGSVLNAGAVSVGGGGSGVLHVDHATVNAATVDIGAFGTLSGDQGVINGQVNNSGVLSPGNSPGRVTINGGIHNSTGASLVLDVQDTGGGTFKVDEVVLTAGSSFDFNNVAVVFNFVGNTDPNAFAASGKFDLDTFLLSQSTAGVDSGLSTTFSAGVTWNAVFADATFQGQSSAYDVTQLTLSPAGTGTFTVAAVPVPEPQTWLLWLAGVGLLAARRRTASA